MKEKEKQTENTLPFQLPLGNGISVEKAKEHFAMIERICKEILRPGVDYDTLPGTNKPVLHKPGAERLLHIFGLGHKVECVDKREEWESGFFYYRYRVSIFKDNIIIAECDGSANSKENKYRDRWVTKKQLVELGLDPSGLETRTRTSQYGEYLLYKISNPYIYDLVNTLQKMAIKRGLIGGVLQATATSGFFTQDLDDTVEIHSQHQTDQTSEKSMSANRNKRAGEKVANILGGVVTALNETELAGRPAIEIVLDSGTATLAPKNLKVFEHLQVGCEVQLAPKHWNERLVISDDRQIRIVTAS